MAVTTTAPASPEAAYVYQCTFVAGRAETAVAGTGATAVTSSSTSASSGGSRTGGLRRLGACLPAIPGAGGVPSRTTGSYGWAPAGRVPDTGWASDIEIPPSGMLEGASTIPFYG